MSANQKVIPLIKKGKKKKEKRKKKKQLVKK